MNNKDWTGNKKSTYATLGASSHSKGERQQHDYYATDPDAINALFEKHDFDNTIWECACGEGHLSERMIEYGKDVLSTDLVYRGFGVGDTNFLLSNQEWHGDIITNPPYKYAQDFVEKSIQLLDNGKQLAMFLKLTFLEGQKRRQLFEMYPPKNIYVFSRRMKCAINGDFKNTGSSAACYAWFVWEKDVDSKPIIDWV